MKFYRIGERNASLDLSAPVHINQETTFGLMTIMLGEDLIDRESIPPN